MKNIKNKIALLLLAILLVFVGCNQQSRREIEQGHPIDLENDQGEKFASDKETSGGKVDKGDPDGDEKNSDIGKITEDARYYSKEDLVKYLRAFGKLPKNYFTKKEARALGWDSSKGNLWEVTDKGVIGGDNFGNREGRLPKKKGRKYFEADVNYQGGKRNAERLVYSNDGLIFYTSDHYNSFEEIRED